MSIRILIVILSMTLSINLYSQSGFMGGKKNLIPESFDTTKENILISEQPNAIIYFKQDEILKFINDPKNGNIIKMNPLKILKDTLQKHSKFIRVKDILYYFDDSGKKDSVGKLICEEFVLLNATLLINGKFMLYSKKLNQIVKQGIFVEKGSINTSDNYTFYLPNGDIFYYVVSKIE